MNLPALDEARIARWLASAPWLPERIAVGFSGGADSTALLLALALRGHRVEAWHVDHGWRPESADEARLLAERVRAWGIPFVSVRADAGGAVASEGRAREGRFEAFARISRIRGLRHLALAHHLRDQAETVCLRLVQGAGPAGLRGMRSWQVIGGLVVWRPFLGVDPGELRAELARAGVDWLEDPANEDLRHRRNRIRRLAFPEMRAAGVDPEALFVRLGLQAERVTAALQERLPAWEQIGRDARIGWRAWMELSPPERARLLQRMVAGLLGEGATPGRRHIELVERWTRRGGRGGVDLSRLRLERTAGGLHLCRRPAGLPA